MTPRLSARGLGTLALVLTLAAPAGARPQRRAPSGGGAPAAERPAAAPRSAPAPAPAPAPASNAGRDSGRGQERAASRGSDGNDATSSGRRRGDLARTGTAVARTSPPRPPHEGDGHGGAIVGYPWWYGGAYYGGYYGGYYAYDPWLGWPPAYETAAGNNDEGALKLKVKPAEASVYVDGYYVGIVDEFDGVFQQLRLESGPHHVEIRVPGDDDVLSFDVLIQPGQTTTYRGELVSRNEER